MNVLKTAIMIARNVFNMHDVVKHSLMMYLFEEDSRLENYMIQLQNNVTYRKADQLDMLEMIMALTRLEYAREDHRRISRILSNYKV